MSDTPNTQAVLQAADGRWTYSIKHFCESMELRIKELENERDTALDDLEFRRGLFQLQEQQLNAVRASRDGLQRELTEMTAYADKLAAGFPEGMLPKDVEVLREANAKLAEEVHEYKASADFWKRVATDNTNANEDVKHELTKMNTEWRREQQELDEAITAVSEERDEYRGLLIELYNDINVIHSGNAVAKLNRLMRDENYN